MILDGWGIAKNKAVSAIDQANTPFMDATILKYPHGKLEASGLAVGLPAGQMGNSEVGHMNIGAGRVVYQDLVKINQAVKENTLKDNPVLHEAMMYAKSSGKKVHFIGLVSDGGVHSHINHLKGYYQLPPMKAFRMFMSMLLRMGEIPTLKAARNLYRSWKITWLQLPGRWPA